MSGAANNPYKQEAPDKTLTQEGVSADAKAVGDALNLKQPKCIRAGNAGTNTFVEINMSTFPKGQYLVIDPISNFIAGFYYIGIYISSNSDNISFSRVGSDTMLNVSGLQKNSDVYLMQIS